MSEAKKLAYFLPNVFTALNMACGFTAILYGIKGQFYNAGMFLLLGTIFDSVDGRVARLTGTSSQFGEQFDSISDVISFGMAPSILVYFRFFQDMGRGGIILSFLFLLCGALRLARFNANINKVSSDYFQGLPIPLGALGVVGLVFISLEFPILLEWRAIPIVYIVFYSLLMISNIPFFSFKDSSWVKKRKKLSLAIIFILLALIFAYEELMIGGITGLYILGNMVRFLAKGRVDDVFEWTESEDEEEKA